MFIVIEIQKSVQGEIATIVNSYSDRSAAEHKYHTILAAASLSGLPRHSAVMLQEDGYKIKNECYGTDAVE